MGANDKFPDDGTIVEGSASNWGDGTVGSRMTVTMEIAVKSIGSKLTHNFQKY